MFAPHAPIDGLEGELADMAGGVALPRADLADAALVICSPTSHTAYSAALCAGTPTTTPD